MIENLSDDDPFADVIKKGVQLTQEEFFERPWMRPEILCHPNIPRPLHGVNPRTIEGRKWWDETRREAYERYDLHCVACGVHKSKAKRRKWLEAHEFWHIDYATGKCEITSIKPLCHLCHNFIHSQRLEAIEGKEKTRQECREILEHGIAVLLGAGLEIFPGTRAYAESLGIAPLPDAYEPIEKAGWNDFYLLWEREEYRGFATIEEWAEHYDVELVDHEKGQDGR